MASCPRRHAWPKPIGPATARLRSYIVLAVADLMTDEHGRPMPPEESGEVETLQGFLAYQRGTLAWKCRGLSDEQLRVALPPTSMTLGGMLKHLAYVEDFWFTEVVGGEPAPEPWASAVTKADPAWDWTTAATDSGAEPRASAEGGAGGPAPEPWAGAVTKADPDWDWTSAATDSGDELRALWAERVSRSDAVVQARLGQDATAAVRE